MRLPWLRDFGAPPDAAAALALVTALIVMLFGERIVTRIFEARRRVLLGCFALSAFALSGAYVLGYLKGGPRIIDATSYFLQARALAEGAVTWAADEPTASARGRFLLMTGPEHAPRLGVIFPPGYPAVLAIGFWLGVPMLIGPILAGLLAVATYALGRHVSGREEVARVAACLSVLCATLRYHTADTMSHGWSALLSTIAVLFAMRARATHALRDASIAGVAVGWLVATRPMSGIVVSLVVVFAAWPLRRGPAAKAPSSVSQIIAFCISVALPVSLFLVQQRLVTGRWFTSSQSLYYQSSDGPPGCFRFGFGQGIGCLHEHGQYVRALMSDGFGLHEALINSLRRLRLHLIDFGNAEPLFALVPLGIWLYRRDRDVLALASAVVLVVLGYAPFYFDGSYPGGGARFYADVLPLEHVLGALAIVRGAELLGKRRAHITAAKMAAFALAIGLAGFALHASYLHGQLASREGGRPFFEPEAIQKSGIDRGLLFTNSDHGYLLAFDPRARDASSSLVVSRGWHDDRDRIVWEKLGRPPAYRYDYDAMAGGEPSILRFSPSSSSVYRFEAEAEWPPLEQRGGFLEPLHASGTCASGGQVLVARPTPGPSMHAVVSFPTPHPGRFRVVVQLAAWGTADARITLLGSRGAAPLASWTYANRGSEFRCASLLAEDVTLEDHGKISFDVRGEPLAIDVVHIGPATSGDI